MEKPCLTLLCTPSQKQTERCHPLEERPLSVRESARIQTFDDEYVFMGSMSSMYKQIGNAVPVELARQVGVALMEARRNGRKAPIDFSQVNLRLNGRERQDATLLGDSSRR